MTDHLIYPVATGAAAKVVEQHQEPQDLVFHSGWVRLLSVASMRLRKLRRGTIVQFCPYVQRTWISLEEKSIPYKYNEVNPYNKEKHFLGMRF